MTAARGYSWPPFEPGNTVALQHGARSPAAIEAKAAVVHNEILNVAPWLDADHFLPAVDRYLRAAARERLLDDFITEVCATKGAGAVTPRTWEQVTSAARLAAKLGSDLGLDPTGHARLKATAATAEIGSITLADLMAQGEQVRRNAQASTVTAATAQSLQEPSDGESEAVTANSVRGGTGNEV